MDIFQIEYFYNIIVFLVVIIFTVILFRNKKILNINKISKRKRKFVEKNYCLLNNIIRSLILSSIIVITFFVVLPSIKDLRRYIYKDYIIIDCRVLVGDDEMSGVFRRRSVSLEDITNGNVINIDVGYTDIHKDEYYKVSYLPNLKIGKIILDKN